MGGRTRHRDSAGCTRPVPLMLVLRVRLAPRWLIRRHPGWVVTITAAAVIIALFAFPGHTAIRQAPCHQIVRHVSCR